MVRNVQPAQALDETEAEVLAILRENLGYDPGETEPEQLSGQLREHVLGEGLQTVRGLREKLLHDPSCRDRLIRRLSRPERRLFHDPNFYRGFLVTIVPLLRTYPFIRLWHMGCGSGEHVYAMAILLREAGLYDRCRLYVTDSDDTTLRLARSGIYDLPSLRSSEGEYRASGGRFTLSSYYLAHHGNGVFDSSLQRNMVFAQHKLLVATQHGVCSAQRHDRRRIQRVSRDNVPRRACAVRSDSRGSSS
jgi:chemotaxis protein methyltransferase CheR